MWECGARTFALMERSLWEIRFRDGRGASFFTSVDPSEFLPMPDVTRTVPVAADVADATALRDARRCIAAGDLVELTFRMDAVAYLVEHPDE